MTEKYSLALWNKTTGAALSGASVELRGDTFTFYGVEIGTSGRYQWSAIDRGRYTLFVNGDDTGETYAVGAGELAGIGYADGKKLASTVDAVEWVDEGIAGTVKVNVDDSLSGFLAEKLLGSRTIDVVETADRLTLNLGAAEITDIQGLRDELDLKQTVFNGVCQKQYLTENDIFLDCSGAVPRFSINTVKNGQVISASNKLCFYTDGSGISQKHTFDAPIYIDFTYTLGIWYFHIDTNGALIATQTAWTNFETVATLLRAYINPALSGSNRLVTQVVEYHKNDISAADHEWKHNFAGTIHDGGLDVVSNVLPTGSPNADGRNTCISITGGKTNDENLSVYIVNSLVTNQFSQDLGNISAGSLTSANSALFKISYNDSFGTLAMLPATRFPFAWNSSTNIPEYITTAGIRTTVPDNSWMVNYVYSFADPRYGEVIKVRSSNISYATITDANAASWEDLRAVFPTLRDREIRPLYKLTHYVNNTGGGSYSASCKYASLVAFDDIRTLRTQQSTATTGSVLASSVVTTPTATLLSTNQASTNAELDSVLTGTKSYVSYSASTGWCRLATFIVPASSVHSFSVKWNGLQTSFTVAGRFDTSPTGFYGYFGNINSLNDGGVHADVNIVISGLTAEIWFNRNATESGYVSSIVSTAPFTTIASTATPTGLNPCAGIDSSSIAINYFDLVRNTIFEINWLSGFIRSYLPMFSFLFCQSVGPVVASGGSIVVPQLTSGGIFSVFCSGTSGTATITSGATNIRVGTSTTSVSSITIAAGTSKTFFGGSYWHTP